MDEVECIVVGAGVIGLAVARALALAGHEVLVLDRAWTIGFETSSRNSEVIHSGIYYPKDSLKATTCVEGRRRLYGYCREHGVAHARLGKIIVASDEAEIPALEKIAAAALANGVDDVERLDAAEARRLEPELHCVAALFSPSTGIIDSHGLDARLSGRGRGRRCDDRVAHPDPCRKGPRRRFRAVDRRRRARHHSVSVFDQRCGALCPRARSCDPRRPARDHPAAYFCRGVYFTLSGKTPFRHLVYPVPPPGGLGVHITLDLAGQARFGPDVEWISSVDYTVNPERGEAFYAAVRRYWPSLRDGALQPGYAGIRPKISGPTEPAADFVVQGPSTHGVPGLVNLYGIESPGLTASLALADEVASRMAET